ncbi:MAG: HAD-IIIC family phosphatase [Alsobacter sp.]
MSGIYSWQRDHVRGRIVDPGLGSSFRFKSAAKPTDIDWRAPLLVERLPERLRIFLNGGCELSYIGAFFEEFGHTVSDTFISGTSADPISEFIGNGGRAAKEFAPDLIVLSCAQILKQAMRSAAFPKMSGNFTAQESQLADITGGLRSAIDRIRVLVPKAKIVLLSNPIHNCSVYGLYEQANYPGRYSIYEIQAMFNLSLAQTAREKAVEFIDFNEVVGRFGLGGQPNSRPSVRVAELTGGHPEVAGAEIIAHHILAFVQATSKSDRKVKCCIFDLDNTLWDGIYREDGHEHVSANLRRNLLDAAHRLSLRGIVLAVVSKNDEEVAGRLSDIFSQAPGFWRAVVAVRTNWLPKSVNIRSVVQELNIGVDSIAFFDDQAYERSEVSEALSDVRVFSEWDLLQVGRFTPFTAASPLSEDSVNRAEMYQVEAARRSAAPPEFDQSSFQEFLIRTGFVLTIKVGKSEHVNRIHELISRTNQQNVTLRRTSREEVLATVADLSAKIFCCYLSDRHGPYGMIGVIIARRSGNDTFLEEVAFSCRAMGKGIEPAFIRKVVRLAAGDGGGVRIRFQRTDKNHGMIEMLEGIGFASEDGELVARQDLLDTRDEPWINWADQVEVEDV